jgi:hypothetical protein
MSDSTTSSAVEWWMGVPGGVPSRSAGSYHRLGKARNIAASGASGRGVQTPLHAREIVESII